ISFGSFRLFPARQLLLDADKPVRLGSRSLEILIALVEQRGDLISTKDLIARTWPNTFVEEGSLRVHVAALRKALGDGQAGKRYVVNIPGRGYRFVAPVSILRGPEATLPQFAAFDSAHNLPNPNTRMVGRADVVSSLIAQFGSQRLITIVGPGGI